VAKNVELRALHRSGFFRINEFKIEPVSGNFSLEGRAHLNTDHPHYTFKASVSNFDLSKMDFGENSKKQISGIFSAHADFTLNANRFAHFLENVRTRFSINFANAYFTGTNVQMNINNLLTANDYQPLPNTLHLPRFEFTIRQSTVNMPYLFSSSGGNLQFSGFGRYSYNRGFDTPFVFTVINEDRRSVRVPVILRGNLLNPELRLSDFPSASQKLF
jgi:hypothetical protein